MQIFFLIYQYELGNILLVFSFILFFTHLLEDRDNNPTAKQFDKHGNKSNNSLYRIWHKTHFRSSLTPTAGNVNEYHLRSYPTIFSLTVKVT